MRFQILNKLFFRSDSNSSRVSLSTPGAPLLAATRLYASHTCCLGMSNGLTCDVGMFPLFLLGNAPVDRIHIPDEPVPWLHPHIQTAGASQLLRTGPPASAASVLGAFGFCLSTLPLSARWLYKPMNGRRIDTRLLTFRARAADQAHAASTPGTTWPIHGRTRQAHPEGRHRTLGFDADQFLRRFNSDAQPGCPGRTLLARLPSPHLTHLVRLFPDAHHDGLQPTQLRVV